ncbi:hypothetical protein [Halomonas sp. HG01]|uniref:hypothetical protein n=1 Tax=Halomonas sp. HG01 TaxID=1609967 RepID=UPI0006148489|nr:hypothetical protein [Halomonas sp. HG01]
MNRRTETFTAAQRKLMVPAHDWQPMIEHKVAGIHGLVPNEPTTWQTGRLMRNARDLALDAVAKFEQWAPRLDAINKNADLSVQGRQRAALEIVTPILEELESQAEAMAEDIETMYRQAQGGLSPVRPLRNGDVVGHAQDREIREFLRGLDDKRRNALHKAMLEGSHPDMVSAVLRAPEAMLSGFTDHDAQRLEAAGIAATHGETLDMLDRMAVAFDDARVSGLRSIDALAGICELRKDGNEVDKRIKAAFAKHPTLAEFRDWLGTIPRPPKQYEPLTEAA